VSIESEAEVDRLLAPGIDALVVDDHEHNRSLLGALLSQLGCSVSLAASGSEAVRLACRKPYHLIIMDWRMPGLNGDETVWRIRRAGPCRHTFIARWSTDPPLGDHVGLYDAELPKPVTCAALARLVASAKRRSSRRRKLSRPAPAAD